MEHEKTLKRSKKDYDDLESYLEKHNLLGEEKLWFAGYDDTARSSRNAVAANLFYGKKNLMVLSVSGGTVHILKNSKDGFRLHTLGSVEDDYNVGVRKGIFWPSIKIETNNETMRIKVVKNKKEVGRLKRLLK